MKKNHDTNFKTPEGYFDQFNERLFARMQADEGEPNTDFLPKTDGFGIPEGYFESVHPNIAKRLKKNTKVIPLFGQKRMLYAAAAAIAVLCVLGLTWRLNQKEVIDFEDLASMDIETYLNENELGLSTYEIAEVMDMDEITLDDFTENTIEEETLLEYLDEHVDEIEDLDLNYEELR